MKKLVVGFGLFLISVAIIIFVNPIGDFPLNDDWQYAYPAKSLIENGTYNLIGAFSPNIFLQVLWGYLFCLPFGEFSFTYLRYSTLVAAIMSGWIFYYLIKTYTNRTNLEALFCTLFLVFNPLYFSLAFSFMTDVPFLGICLLSIFFYLKYILHQNSTYRILGAIVSIATLFLRQPGILILIDAEVAILGFHFLEKKNHQKVITSIALIFMSILAYSFIESFLKPYLQVEKNYISVGDEYLDSFIQNPLFFIFQIAKRSLMTIFYLGLFLLPFISLIIQKVKETHLDKKWIQFSLLVFNVIITIVLLQTGFVFPYGGNIFYNLGLGPLLLKDTLFLDMNAGFELPIPLMIGGGFICQILGCYLILFLLNKIYVAFKEPLKHQLLLALVLINLLYLGAMIVFSYFDRYLLLLIASILIILMRENYPKKIYQYKSVIVLSSLMMVFSVLATKDFLQWNRTCHQAFTHLKAQGFDSKKIDAGLPINGFEETIDDIDQTHEYVLSFNQIEGYETIDSYPFYRWLFLQKDEILVLQRNNQ